MSQIQLLVSPQARYFCYLTNSQVLFCETDVLIVFISLSICKYRYIHIPTLIDISFSVHLFLYLFKEP